jgi:carbon monoxide dehydrogenase subunit G
MKYSNEVVIQLPVARVVELFDNPDNMRHWQPGLVSFEHVSGTPGQPGAKSRLRYKMGKRDIEMIETVTQRDLPHTFSGTYEAKGVFNIVSNHFEALPDGSTRYVSDSEFQFKGLMMKLIGLLMPGAFKKQSQKYLDDFKAFAEKQGA